MIEPKGFEDLVRRLNKLLPEGVEEIRDELRANFQAAVSASLAKIELVTREEFDVQRAVLARRAKSCQRSKTAYEGSSARSRRKNETAG